MTRPTEPKKGEWLPGALAFAPDEKTVDAAYDVYERWMDGWWQAQDESLRFCRAFLARSLDATASLAASKNPMEVLDVQMRYAGAALNDCFDEAMRMFVLAGEATMQGFTMPKPASKHPTTH